MTPSAMTSILPPLTRRTALGLCGLGVVGVLPVALHAEAPALYDPQPPADSAYLRVLVTAFPGPVQVWIDDRLRLPALAPLRPSDYLVLPAGRHAVRVQAGEAQTRFTFEAVSGRASTAVLTTVQAKASPQILEDKPGSNRLKALLTAYHLAPGAGPLDVLTADGSARVFAGLMPGQSASLAVNPVAVELIVVRAGDKAALAKMSLQLSAGGAYSLVLTPGADRGVAAASHANQVERYTAP